MREPMMVIAVGQKGVGKTFRTTEDAKRYLEVQKRPVLFFDTNGEYHDVKPIAFDVTARTKPIKGKKGTPPLDHYRMGRVIEKWCAAIKTGKASPEIRRVKAELPNGRPMTTEQRVDALQGILASFYGGLLVLEDYNKYATGARNKEVLGHIVTNRHNEMDIIMHLQSFSVLEPKLIENTNHLRLHLVSGNIDKLKSKVGDFYLWQLGHSVVQAVARGEGIQADPRYYLYLDQDANKLIRVDDAKLRAGIALLHRGKSKPELDRLFKEAKLYYLH